MGSPDGDVVVPKVVRFMPWKQIPQQTGDKGVAPLIGIILMVAMTVVLASVFGVFTLDTERELVRDSPQAALTVEDMPAEYTTGDGTAEGFVRVEFDSGSPVELNHLRIEFREDATGSLVGVWEAGFTAASVGDWDGTLNGNSLAASQTFVAGDVIEFTVNDDAGIPEDDTVYRVTLIDTRTDTPIFETTVRVA